MTDFVILENVALFNRLLASEQDPAKRRTILQLLAQEIEKIPDDAQRRLACGHLQIVREINRDQFATGGE